MRRLLQGVMIAAALLSVSACQNTSLRSLEKPGEGPDEFRIVPGKPLEPPPDYATLPAPTPGGANLTDQNPEANAIAALGGRAPTGAAGIPAGDTALVSRASRFGIDPNIRATLNVEDADFRQRRGRFTQIRIVPTDTYSEIYSRQTLDPFVEVARWRRAGARTPSSPPQ